MPRHAFGNGRALPVLLAAALLAALAGCDDVEEAAAPEPRLVRVVEVAAAAAGRTASLSGVVEAQTEAALGFRIGGRMIARLAEVGDTVEAGEIVARLDAADEENALRAARATLSAATAQRDEARLNYDRQAQLLERGFTTRQRYDQARQVLTTTQGQLDAAQAQVEIAANRLSDTELRADAEGVVTETGAEPGEVVAAGRMIVRLARDGGRDAVFDAPAALIQDAPYDPAVRVALTIDPSVTAEGRVREVSPRADPVTGAFRVRVGLIDPPEALRLGSTVSGTVTIGGTGGYVVPASALTRSGAQPAVWVVDPAAATVSLRAVELAGFGPAEVTVTGGLTPGEIVVTAGVQALRPGMTVRLPGGGA